MYFVLDSIGYIFLSKSLISYYIILCRIQDLTFLCILQINQKLLFTKTLRYLHYNLVRLSSLNIVGNHQTHNITFFFFGFEYLSISLSGTSFIKIQNIGTFWVFCRLIIDGRFKTLAMTTQDSNQAIVTIKSALVL